MNFNSLPYLIFLLVVAGLYWLLAHRWQNLFLVLGSYFFLGFIHPWFAGLLFAVCMIHFVAGSAMEQWPNRRRLVLISALTASLLILGFFKYANFFLENVKNLLLLTGLPSFSTTLTIILPLGISFYTFQAIAYTVDVYRGKVQPQKNFVDFVLYISFFPQLAAGPIARAQELMPQIQQPRIFDSRLLNHGLLLLMWGFFKKIVIADNCGLIVYKVFNTADPDFYMLWAGVYAFAIQILADFWSYTDIARGSASLLGFKLAKNFNHPYLSTSLVDFWHRWHISLSSWLRDYIYIPLGGSRVSVLRIYRNIMVTFLLSGLWHGASWNFVLWGGYHGLLLWGQRWLQGMSFPFLSKCPGWCRGALQSGKILLTFLLVCVGWLIFKVTDLTRLIDYLLLSPRTVSINEIRIAAYLFFLSFLYSLPLWIHGLGHSLGAKWYQKSDGSIQLPERLLCVQPVLLLILFLGILTLQSPEPALFIYSQF